MTIIHRWVWSEMETLTDLEGKTTVRPVVREYAIRDPLIPKHLGETWALCHVEFLQHQYLAALQDPRVTILDSLHSNAPVHPKAAEHLAPHGVKPEHTVHDALLAVFQKHGDPGFLPEK